MKRSWLIVLNILLFIFISSSCKKEDEDKPENILMAKAWKRGMVDKNTATNPNGDIVYYPVQNCEKDDTFEFGSNNVLTIEQGTNKCANEPATKTVSYSFDKSSKELMIDGIKYTMAEESKTQIKYYRMIPTATGYSYLIFLLE